jgi:hypothetical protein
MNKNWRHNPDGLEDEKQREAQNGFLQNAWLVRQIVEVGVSRTDLDLRIPNEQPVGNLQGLLPVLALEGFSRIRKYFVP